MIQAIGSGICTGSLEHSSANISPTTNFHKDSNFWQGGIFILPFLSISTKPKNS